MRPRGRMKIFGIDDAVFGMMGAAALNAGTSIWNNSQSNANNLLAQVGAQNFNASQAEISRGWTSGEAEKARNWSDYLAHSAQQFNAGEAQKARDYTTMMSNSAYQRQIADMKAAGLNPIMAAMKGGGADTPGGAQASASPGGTAMAGSVASPTTSPVHLKPVMENVISSALEAARAMPTIRGLNQDVETKEADTALRKSQDMESKTRTAVNNATAKNVEADTRFKEAQTENVKRQQSEVSVLGNRVNPAYYVDKAASALPGILEQGRDLVSRGVTSAKNWWNMIGGD